MKNPLFFFSLVACMWVSCTKDRQIHRVPLLLDDGQTVIHYWDFNNSSRDEFLKPSQSLSKSYITFTLNDDSLPFCGGGNQSCWEPVNDGTLFNIQGNASAGNAIRLRNPCSTLEINATTFGFGDITLSYAIKRTGSGAKVHRIQYATDGVQFKEQGLTTNTFDVAEEYTLIQVDFSKIPGCNNNPSLRFRIIFEEGNVNPSGNNRLDNLMIAGKKIK
jgi:hypothetical protein